MTYSGEERRKIINDHDLLTSINTKLTILLSHFDNHLKEDKETFEKHDNRIKKIENVVYMCTGIIVFLEIIIKLIK